MKLWLCIAGLRAASRSAITGPDSGRRGLGIAQILVAGLLLLLTVGAVVALYGRSYQAFERGSGRVAAMRAAGQASRAITVLFRSAGSNDPTAEVTSLGVGQSAESVDFVSAVDWLEEGESLPRRYRLQFSTQERALELINLESEARRVLVKNLGSVEFGRPGRRQLSFQLSWDEPAPGFVYSDTVVLPLVD